MSATQSDGDVCIAATQSDGTSADQSDGTSATQPDEDVSNPIRWGRHLTRHMGMSAAFFVLVDGVV